MLGLSSVHSGRNHPHIGVCVSTITELQAKVDYQRYLLDLLEMWSEVQAQGFDPEQVEALTLRDDFLTREQQRYREQQRIRNRVDPYSDGSKPKMFNAVRLKDGSLQALKTLIRRRTCPEHCSHLDKS